jgi:hypothetical protein
LYGIDLGLVSVIVWNGITLGLCFGLIYAKLKWGKK